jgi:DNA-binding NarL/FixJ family response regulator
VASTVHTQRGGLVLATMAAQGPACDDAPMTGRQTVLIVDDHEGFRAAARALLEAEGFDVIGEAGDGQEALDVAGSLRPDIVVLDVQLPGLDGFAVAEQLAATAHAPAVVLISSRDASAYGPRLGQAPTRGFIPKSGLSGEALAKLVG